MTTPPAAGASTVPGVISALQAHMQAVADASPLNVGVSVGQLIGDAPNNFFCIGDPVDGSPILIDFASEPTTYMPVGENASRQETYSVSCTLRTWDAKVTPVITIGNAFALLQALQARIASDRDAGGAITGGVWQLVEIEDGAAGRMDKQGWGFVLLFRIAVTGAFIQA